MNILISIHASSKCNRNNRSIEGKLLSNTNKFPPNIKSMTYFLIREIKIKSKLLWHTIKVRGVVNISVKRSTKNDRKRVRF